MTTNNPAFPIFDPAFCAQYLIETTEDAKPDFAGRTDVDAVRGQITTMRFADRVAKGEQFFCDDGLHAMLFSNELGPEHRIPFEQALERIVWSRPIQDVLDRAGAKLAALPGQPLALHVRRGDVLDKDPWRHKNWVSKFAPDEFYEAVMDQPDTAAVLFSDTPAVVARMAANRPNTVTLDDLVDADGLSILQRDVVELVLMSRCRDIVAPSLSAFSSSAAMMGGMGVTSLPRGLPEEQRLKAADALLARTFGQPDSFHNTGDYAQSFGYAFRHALKIKRHRRAYRELCGAMDAGQDYAFYLPLMMALAVACGNAKHALRVHKKAKSDPNLWLDDRMICDALGTIALHQSGDKTAATSAFLEQFLRRRKTVVNLDSLANYFFTAEPDIRDLFMLDDVTRKALQLHRIFLFPDEPDLLDGAMVYAYPFWLLSADWPEMFESRQALKNAVNDPPFQDKRASFPRDIRQAELAFFKDDAPLPQDRETVALLSAMSVCLSLSGRYRRATNLMYHCRKYDPDNPLMYKRLANRFVATSHLDKADRNLGQALQRAPRHNGLVIARGQVAMALQDHARANDLLAGIAERPDLPFAFYKTWEKVLRKQDAQDAAHMVIKAAADRFPDHPIFARQWAGKV